MNIKGHNLHVFATCALFTMGSTVISLPFYNSGMFTLLLSAFIFLLGILLSAFLKKAHNKACLFAAALFIFISSLYGIIFSLKEYLNFLKSEQMPQTSIFILFITVCCIILFFSISSKDSIYKYGLFTFVLCCLIILLVLISGIKNFNSFEIFADKSNYSSNFFINFIFTPFFSGIVLSFFAQKKESTSKPVFLGCITGFVMLFICLFQAKLTLPSSYETAYPYFRAISVISTGSLFTRLDGLIYFLFFVCSVIKIVICIKSIFLAFSILRNKI